MLRAAILLLLITVPLAAQDAKMVVAGKITGPDGKPVKGATVKLVPFAETHRVVWPTVDKAKAVGVAKDGTFRFDRERRAWLVVAAAPGRGEIARIISPEETAPCEIRLEKALKIAGVVLDEKRKPVKNASLLLMREDDSLRGPIPRDGFKAETDKSGRFAFEGLAPAKYCVHVRVKGKPIEYVHDVEAGETNLKVRLGAGKPIRGRVVDANGKPVRGVMIQVHSDRDVVWGKTTDADGRFATGPLNPKRTYRISVDPRGKGKKPADVEGVTPGGEEITIELK